ncbi:MULTISPECIES: head GIN domain-containing protein [Flavobacterium]|uniref:Head GIN domain-containing protein n=1 Tax=Flavobacterium jumunjinense TaxID=998845 RepID=A0ABV5GQW2_9FLAO|nr:MULTISPECIES: head GIN domain-containing protein [Flavobacterium]
MKKHIKIALVLLLFIVTSCGISEDCFKGNGNRVSQSFPLEDFTKVKVYSGVGLVIKEGPNYEVRVETSDNIIDDLDVKVVDDMLIVKDNSTCNITRDYGLTIIYVTAPNLIEIHSKTEQDIISDGVLGFPELKFVSIDLSDGAGTGDFYLTVNCINLFIESNNVSNFYMDGFSQNLNVSFYWGIGKFNAEELFISENLFINHKGSNDIILYPLKSIYGDIYGVGNIIIKNRPLEEGVFQHYTGRVIHDY